MITPNLAGIDGVWAAYGAWIVAGSGALLALLVVALLVRFARSARKSAWIGRLTGVVVLAWTSEGMWQFVRDRLHAPIVFAVVSFFVFEAMTATAASQAEEHRNARGVPGPAGRYVWVIAASSGLVASLGALSPFEVPFRVGLPLLAVGLWWLTLTAERPSDTEQMRGERARRAAEREATWAVTPRDLLVYLGVLKPGRSTVTDAQRDHQVRRMVVAADTIASGSRWRVRRARRRLRRLARTATPEMVEVVARQVRQAVEAERLMVPPAAPERAADRESPDSVEPAMTDTSADSAPATVADTTPVTVAAVPRQQRRTRGRTSNADKIARAVAKNPGASYAAIAAKVGVSERTVQRHLSGAAVDSKPDSGHDTTADTTQVNGATPDLDAVPA